MGLPASQPPTAMDLRATIEAAQREALERRQRFLAAWKRGVVLAGPEYFSVRAATVKDATDKDQLRPDLDMIEHALGRVSHGQGAFLAALYSFLMPTKARSCSQRPATRTFATSPGSSTASTPK